MDCAYCGKTKSCGCSMVKGEDGKYYCNLSCKTKNGNKSK